MNLRTITYITRTAIPRAKTIRGAIIRRAQLAANLRVLNHLVDEREATLKTSRTLAALHASKVLALEIREEARETLPPTAQLDAQVQTDSLSAETDYATHGNEDFRILSPPWYVWGQEAAMLSDTPLPDLFEDGFYDDGYEQPIDYGGEVLLAAPDENDAEGWQNLRARARQLNGDNERGDD